MKQIIDNIDMEIDFYSCIVSYTCYAFSVYAKIFFRAIGQSD